MTGQVRLEAHVAGRVQGVGFRAFVVRQAQQMGCTGYVANSPDGRAVVVVAEGQRPALERLLSSVRQGPRLAHVVDVRAEWSAPSSEFTDFTVRD